ncbi:MAG: HPr family phosphocarrier protein [Clostridia bacterium]
MKEFNYIVKDEVGLHARPAGALVKFVTTLSSKVTLKKGEKAVDAKRLFGIMGLAVKCGDELTFVVEGENAEADAAALESFCKESF